MSITLREGSQSSDMTALDAVLCQAPLQVCSHLISTATFQSRRLLSFTDGETEAGIVWGLHAVMGRMEREPSIYASEPRVPPPSIRAVCEEALCPRSGDLKEGGHQNGCPRVAGVCQVRGVPASSGARACSLPLAALFLASLVRGRAGLPPLVGSETDPCVVFSTQAPGGQLSR